MNEWVMVFGGALPLFVPLIKVVCGRSKAGTHPGRGRLFLRSAAPTFRVSEGDSSQIQ